MRSPGESALSELEADFRRDGNPVLVWQAIAVARRYGIGLPVWTVDFLADVADRIMDIRDEVAGGKPAGKEAERVGKALGFGTGGPGHGGWFKLATMLERDRTIFFQVDDRFEAGTKLDYAYDEVAKALDVSRSTVVRAYRRIGKLNHGDNGSGTDEEKIS